jgi:hypothetical protein
MGSPLKLFVAACGNAGFSSAVDRVSELAEALMVAPRQTVGGASLFNASLEPQV